VGQADGPDGLGGAGGGDPPDDGDEVAELIDNLAEMLEMSIDKDRRVSSVPALMENFRRIAHSACADGGNGEEVVEDLYRFCEFFGEYADLWSRTAGEGDRFAAAMTVATNTVGEIFTGITLIGRPENFAAFLRYFSDGLPRWRTAGRKEDDVLLEMVRDLNWYAPPYVSMRMPVFERPGEGNFGVADVNRRVIEPAGFGPDDALARLIMRIERESSARTKITRAQLPPRPAEITAAWLVENLPLVTWEARLVQAACRLGYIEVNIVSRTDYDALGAGGNSCSQDRKVFIPNDHSLEDLMTALVHEGVHALDDRIVDQRHNETYAHLAAAYFRARAGFDIVDLAAIIELDGTGKIAAIHVVDQKQNPDHLRVPYTAVEAARIKASALAMSPADLNVLMGRALKFGGKLAGESKYIEALVEMEVAIAAAEASEISHYPYPQNVDAMHMLGLLYNIRSRWQRILASQLVNGSLARELFDESTVSVERAGQLVIAAMDILERGSDDTRLRAVRERLGKIEAELQGLRAVQDSPYGGTDAGAVEGVIAEIRREHVRAGGRDVARAVATARRLFQNPVTFYLMAPDGKITQDGVLRLVRELGFLPHLDDVAMDYLTEIRR
jgi:hypothetical protein